MVEWEAGQGRLPGHLVPSHYKLHLAPCLTTFTFSGRIEATLDLLRPVTKLVLNAKQLEVQSITLVRRTVGVEEQMVEQEQVGEEKEAVVDSPKEAELASMNSPKEAEPTAVLSPKEASPPWPGDALEPAEPSDVQALLNDWGSEEEDEAEEVERNSGGEESRPDHKDESSSSPRALESGEEGADEMDGQESTNGDVEDGCGVAEVVQCSDESDSSETAVVGEKRKSPVKEAFRANKFRKDDSESEDEIHEVSDDDQVEDMVQVDGCESVTGKEDDDDVEPWTVVTAAQEEVAVAGWEVLEEEEVLLVRLEGELEPGNLTLTITYSGRLDDSMRGFYRTRHPQGWGAACHFEATGARKCFPCIDQPEFRATFDISVERPAPGLTLLSNMPVQEEEGHLVRFRRTPPLPSYLVCIVIGSYSVVGRRSSLGVPVSVYTPEGRTGEGEYALTIAAKALDYFSDFFGQDYSLPKLDLVTVPDFYIGAMENWGLLTFRETALLLDTKGGKVSQRARLYVSVLVTHEVAHQWFGNLVSIEWWDQLWLKEGFATWVSFLAVDRLCPELDGWAAFLTSERLPALELDALSTSHPIQIPDGVQHPAQIDEIFDEISYSKGASIINMLYHWIGPEAFQAGLQLYLARHRGAAASTEQLWAAVGEASGRPVPEVMADWARVQGFPLVTVTELAGYAGVVLKQAAVGGAPAGHLWRLPLRLEVRGPGGELAAARDLLLQAGEEEVALPLPPGHCLLVNAGQTSFCRVQYSSGLLGRLTPCLAGLDSRDRAGLLSDLTAAVAGGRAEARALVALLRTGYTGETAWPPLQATLAALALLEELLEDTPAWPAFLTFAYSVVRPSLAALGWAAAAGEEPGRGLARAGALERLARLGCVETVGRAYMEWRARDRALQPDLRRGVWGAVARAGGRQEAAALQAIYTGSSCATERGAVLAALAQSSRPAEVLAWAVSPAVRSQDRAALIAGVAASGAEGRSIAWAFFKREADGLLQQYTSGNLLKVLVLGVTRRGGSEAEAEVFTAWFADRPEVLRAVGRSLAQAAEEVRARAAGRERLRAVAGELFMEAEA